MILDLRQDAADFRQYLSARVQQQALTKPTELVHVIQVGFYFTQSGSITVYFSPKASEYSDGAWTRHIGTSTLQRPAWHQAFSQCDDVLAQPLTLIAINGSETHLPAGSPWQEVSQTMLTSIGDMIKHTLMSARDEGLFATLSKGPGCWFSLEEFDGGYFWPTGGYQGSDHRL